MLRLPVVGRSESEEADDYLVAAPVAVAVTVVALVDDDDDPHQNQSLLANFE